MMCVGKCTVCDIYLFLSYHVCTTKRLMPANKQISEVLLIYHFALSLNSMEGQLLVDMGEEYSEGGENDKCDNTSDSSGFLSSCKSNTESEFDSVESITLRRQSQQEVIPRPASEPPPIIPRRKEISSLSPRTLGFYSPTKSTLELLPSLKRTQSTPPQSPSPTPPPLPLRNKSPRLLHHMLLPHCSTTPSTPKAHSSSETGRPSPPPRPPKTKQGSPSSPDQPLQKPSPPPNQQVSTKPQEAPTVPNSSQPLLSVSSHQITPSSSIVDPDSSSWPGQSLPNENLERKWYESFT